MGESYIQINFKNRRKKVRRPVQVEHQPDDLQHEQDQQVHLREGEGHAGRRL